MLPLIEEDVQLTIKGNNNTINGNNQHWLFFVRNGTVNFDDLTFRNGRAQGDNGGGGAAGMGGALFVFNGTVTVTNSTFQNNGAMGGNGGGRAAGGNANFTPFPRNNGRNGGFNEDGGPGGFGGNAGNAGDRRGGGNGNNGGPGDFGGGGFGGFSSSTGGNGGNGGSGGSGGDGIFNGGNGGGGSGGGMRDSFSGSVNFGSGGGTGGGGAGMGSAIFIRLGELSVLNSSFNSNTAQGGTGTNNGQGLGGAIFALDTTTNSNSNNQGMPSSLPTVALTDVTFSGNSAANDLGGLTPASITSGTILNNDDLFGNRIARTGGPRPNLSPTDLNLSGSSINSNSDDGAVVGTFETSDFDVSDSFTYRLVSGDGDDDNDAFTISGDELLTKSSLDFENPSNFIIRIQNNIRETQSRYSIRVQTTDSAGASYSEALTINVIDVAEPPTDINLSGSSINSNSDDGAVVGTFETSDEDNGDTFTYQLVTGDVPNDNDAFTIVGDSLRINSSPDFETQSSYSIRVQTTDSDRLSYSEALTINVNDVPEPPTDIVLSNSSINSNSDDGAVVGTFETSDEDNGDTFTYQLVTGDVPNDNDAFTIVGDSLRINSSPDFETQSSYSIRVQTTDSDRLSYSEALTINVNDVPEPPTDIVLSNSSINSNSDDGAVVGTFETTDPDIGDSFTYRLVSGMADNNDVFSISGNQLRINSSPDFETQSSYSIRVQTTDSDGLSYSEALTISVNNIIDESPTDLVLSNRNIDENSASGSVVGTFSTTDPDEGDTFTYQLVSGAGADNNAAFTIVGDQLRINSSPNFETQSSYIIRVQTTDFAGVSYTVPEKSKAFMINVNDVAESPTDIVLSNRRINSNSPSGAVVGTFSTTDPDVSDSFTYQLVSSAGADNNAAFTIVGDQLRINSSPDFETQSSYLIRVQTTDFAGASYTVPEKSEAFMINVNDVAESPTDLVLSNNSINSNSPLGAVVGTFGTADPDNSDSFTYQLVFGNNAFTIVGDQLRINSSLDFETQEIYIIEVQTTDSANNALESVLIIDVNDVAESPTDINLSSSSINENSPEGAVVGTFSTTDPEDGDSFTYMLVSGVGDDDNDAFTIVGDSLRINSSPDFETQSSYSIRVQTIDATGASYEEALTLDFETFSSYRIFLQTTSKP